MNVEKGLNEDRKKWMRRLALPALAITFTASAVGYRWVQPMMARAASASPSAAPLDTDSVGELLALDKAMETLAAHVTPVVVNVEVTSRSKQDRKSTRL